MRIETLEKKTTPVRTEAEALNLVRELANKAHTARLVIDRAIPGADAQMKAAIQRSALYRFLQRYGMALGALQALHCAGLVSDQARGQLEAELLAMMAPSTVGRL